MKYLLKKFWKPEWHQNCALLRMFVRMDFILRYQNSVLGFLWVFLKPFLIFMVLSVVFSYFFGGQIEHFTLYLLLGIILMQFFSDGTLFGMNSILNKAHVVLKINFPKGPVVMASVFGALLHLFFALLIFVGFLAYYQIVPSLWNIVLFGGLVLALLLFVLGLSFLFALWIIPFRDLGAIWEVFLTAFFYLVPVFYPLSILPEKIQALFWLNPLTQIVTYSRDLLIYDKLVGAWIVLKLILFGCIFCSLASVYFHKKIQYFSEKV